DEGGDRRSEPGVVRAEHPKADRNGHRSEERGRAERECDCRHRRSSLRSASAAAGSATTIPAMISAAPVQPHAPSRSPASQKPKNAAKTGSSAKASAVRVALRLRCAQVWTRKPSALAKTPVTTSALHTVQPCGT